MFQFSFRGNGKVSFSNRLYSSNNLDGKLPSDPLLKYGWGGKNAGATMREDFK
jgi:hypothetical protein